MGIVVTCPSCRREFRVPDQYAGKERVCPGCAHPVSIPGGRTSPPEPEFLEEPRPVPARPAGPPEPEFLEDPKPVQATGGAAPVGRKGVRRTCPECGGKIPLGRSRCPECGEYFSTARNRRRTQEEEREFFAPEKKALNWGMAGGLLMMLIAVVWFFAGLAFGILFFYPPILFIIGLFGLFKGLATGNVAGGRGARTRRRRYR